MWGEAVYLSSGITFAAYLPRGLESGTPLAWARAWVLCGLSALGYLKRANARDLLNFLPDHRWGVGSIECCDDGLARWQLQVHLGRLFGKMARLEEGDLFFLPACLVLL